MKNEHEARRLPLHDDLVALGAHMGSFAGYAVALYFRKTGDRKEQYAVRGENSCGLFYIAHMGRIIVSGAGALSTLERLLPSEIGSLPPGRVKYTALLTDFGTFIDDITICKVGWDKWFLIVNAATKEKVLAWLEAQKSPDTAISDVSESTVLFAIQGATALHLLASLTTHDLVSLPYYHFCKCLIGGVPAFVSRTGYTGAKVGFELCCYRRDACRLLNALLLLADGFGLVPCGFLARDTLRLEAGMPLYGQDIDEEHTVLEAGLERIVAWDKPTEFIGKQALLRERERGIRRRLVGFSLAERRIPRQHYPILSPAGERIGEVTSGANSPTLKKCIGMGYVEIDFAKPGTEIAIKIDGLPYDAEIVQLPFLPRIRS